MAQKLSALPNDATVKDINTLYYGKTIVWRIADKNHTGYPSNSVTLIADKILCLKAFDAKEPSNTNADRKNYGNNRYNYANIRKWLNSAAASWYSAAHNADAPPTSANVWSGHNPYDTEAGFLAGFSPQFAAALLSTTRTIAKNTVTDGGGSEQVTDKIFLASNTEVGLANENSIVEGSKLAIFSDNTSRLAYPTAEAVANSSYTDTNFNTGAPWYWWLSTPYAANSFLVRNVNASGTLNTNYAYYGYGGVRPLCNLSSEILVSDTVDSDGAYTIIWNRAPTTPASITVPDTAKGGSTLDISWGLSTDEDGNLGGYRLERQVGEGGWEQIAETGNRTYADTITYGWSTVAYRVKAYDTNGAESAYLTSETRTVFNNRAPSAPASITVPTSVVGGSMLTVTWGLSTDADGNLSGYKVERQVDSGAWTQIAQTSARTYTDSITFGWKTVAYRVKAYDAEGAESGYKTSASRTVFNNTAPVISGSNTDLGNFSTTLPTFTYSVTDADGDVVTAKVYYDNALVSTFTPALGTSYNLKFTAAEWLEVLNGQHTWRIDVADTSGATAKRTVTFTKAVTEVLFTTSVLESSDMPTKAILSMQGHIAAGATLLVEICNNGNDTVPIWQDVTAKVVANEKIFFSNQNKTAPDWGVGLRVTINRGTATTTSYISQIGGNFG